MPWVTCVQGGLMSKQVFPLVSAVGFYRYEIVYSSVDGKPEWPDICLKQLVGERGFEPPTPWSRTGRLRFLRFQII
jgi:hypothetical protein